MDGSLKFLAWKRRIDIVLESEVIEHINGKVSSKFMERDSYEWSPHIAILEKSKRYDKLVRTFSEDAGHMS